MKSREKRGQGLPEKQRVRTDVSRRSDMEKAEETSSERQEIPIADIRSFVMGAFEASLIEYDELYKRLA